MWEVSAQTKTPDCRDRSSGLYDKSRRAVLFGKCNKDLSQNLRKRKVHSQYTPSRGRRQQQLRRQNDNKTKVAVAFASSETGHVCSQSSLLFRAATSLRSSVDLHVDVLAMEEASCHAAEQSKRRQQLNNNSSSNMTKNEQLMVLQKRQQQIEKELAWIKRQVAMAAEQTSESVKAEGGATTASTCDCAVALASNFSRQPPPCRNVVPYGSIVEDYNPHDTSPLLVRYENDCRASPSSSRRDQEKRQSAAPPGTPPENIMFFDSGGHLEWDECFSHVRSEEDLENEKVHKESDLYLKSSMFARAIPERLFALLVTMILEIPVLLMISGGSDALCMLIGRRRYQLLIGFLPLTSAISGNVGLQASTLTTRAISHLHVTPENYLVWLGTEIGASVYLGAGMGFFLGSVAFWAAGMDMSFGLTIAIAQILSILTAGCTGTLAPLLFSFIFRRDSGKWGGPLETAVQDIVGSFAMVVVSYRILLWLGPGPIRPDDMCGGGS